MDKWFLIYLIFFTIQGASGENQVTDSIELNRELSYVEELLTRNNDSALIISKNLTIKALRLNNKNIACEAMIRQGEAYKNLGKKDSSLWIINEVLNQSIVAENRICQMKAHIGLAETYLEDYNFEDAMKNLVQSEKLLQNSDPFDIRFDIQNNLAITHRRMKDNKTAIKIYNSLLDNFYYQLSTVQKFFVFNNLGIIHAKMKDYNTAEELFNKAYLEIKDVGTPNKLAMITYNMGALFLRQKKYEKAEEYVSKTLDAYLEINDKIQIENCYRVLGAIQIDLKNYETAKDLHFKALKIAKEINNPIAIKGNYRNLHLIYGYLANQTGRVDLMQKELEYFKKYAYLNDSLYQIEMADKILELEKEYETEKKNNQITLLEKDNLLKEDKIKMQRAQRNSLLIIIAIGLGAISIFIYALGYYKKVNKLLQKQSKRIRNQHEEISSNNEKLQKAIDTQNKLFSIIAHDLRSPLVSIANFSRLIHYYLKDNKLDSVKEMAKEMEHKNNYVLELTDNLLSWAKSQSKELNPHFEIVSIREIIEECLDIYEGVSVDKKIELLYKEQEDCQLWADRNMVKTIVRNLINNAIKFTQTGGQVTISYKEKDNLVELCIADNGIGMPKKQASELFKTDNKVIKSGTNGEKSSGLGLSICQEFTEVMGGTIHAKSDQAQGCQFFASLPIYQNQSIDEKIQSTPEFNFSNSLN